MTEAERITGALGSRWLCQASIEMQKRNYVYV